MSCQDNPSYTSDDDAKIIENLVEKALDRIEKEKHMLANLVSIYLRQDKRTIVIDVIDNNFVDFPSVAFKVNLQYEMMPFVLSVIHAYSEAVIFKQTYESVHDLINAAIETIESFDINISLERHLRIEFTGKNKMKNDHYFSTHDSRHQIN